MKTLHLNVSASDLDAIERGTKKFVKHPTGKLWSRILEGRSYDRIVVKSVSQITGLPRMIALAWRGYETQFMHLRGRPVEVFAIRVGSAL